MSENVNHANRRDQFKKGCNLDAARRRREDTTLQIRKNKREEGLAKRRAFQRDVAPVLAPKPDAGNPQPGAGAPSEKPTLADMPRLLEEIQSQDPAKVVVRARRPAPPPPPPRSPA